MDGDDLRHRGRAASRTAFALACVIGLERIVITAIWVLLLYAMVADAAAAADAPARRIPVHHLGQGPDTAASTSRAGLLMAAVWTAASLAITLLALWSLFGLWYRVTWRFVFGIQLVVAVSACLRLLLGSLATLMMVGMWGGWGLLGLVAELPIIAWGAGSVILSVVVLGLLRRADVRLAFGRQDTGADRRRRQDASASPAR